MPCVCYDNGSMVVFRGKKLVGRLEAVAFMTGFALMAFEMVAARILAPSVGSSTYVWTSVIGVIIAALSLGYWVGGMVADIRARLGDIVWLCLLASLMVVATLLIHRELLSWVTLVGDDSRVQAVIASILLFAPVSFLLGMLSPYLVKLKVTSLDTSGKSVASLSALNSIGGIAGTFATGFILFGYIGSRETLVIVILLLLMSSWLIAYSYRWALRAAFSVILLVMAVLPAGQAGGVARIDTPSAHYDIVQTTYDKQLINALITGPGHSQSAVYLGNPNALVFWYNQQIAKVAGEKKPKDILVLGGGAFTLPQYLANTLPDSNIDVVEIDPQLEKISEKYFEYTHPANVNLIFDDARIYVDETDKAYDMVVVDVYGANSIPFTFMTREFGQSVARITRPEGVVVANVIGGLHGKCREVTAAVDSAYRVELPHAQWATQSGKAKDAVNYIITYTKTPQDFAGMTAFSPLGGPLYTDNFSPSDRLHFACESA